MALRITFSMPRLGSQYTKDERAELLVAYRADCLTEQQSGERAQMQEREA